jgi:acyl-CoA thioesterase II
VEIDRYTYRVAELWDDLLACLDLGEHAADPALGDTALRDDTAAATAFEGKNLPLDYHRLFGGQLLAQFAVAAAASCPGKSVKSLHALFPREGTATEPVRYEVARHQDGRTFATLTIVARQSKGVIATASVSLHAPEAGRALQAVDPVEEASADSEPVEIGLLPFETRTAVSLDAREAGGPEFSMWLRTPPVDGALAPALAAYATDLTLIGTALRAVDGVSQRDAGEAFTSAVTSHTIWFHRPFRTDEWLLLRQHGPILAHGRGFGRGDILTSDGTLVASYAQEAMVRFRDATQSADGQGLLRTHRQRPKATDGPGPADHRLPELARDRDMGGLAGRGHHRGGLGVRPPPLSPGVAGPFPA